jgi:hypothetical protein
MSTAAVTAATTGAAVAAAAAAARLKEEEENMTAYGKDDLEGWEFKILRANTRYFKEYKKFQMVCEQEAKAGWEMVEKFDDSRIRFKRRIDKRSNDRHLEIDPYRTNVGISSGTLGAVITGSILAAVGIALVLVFLFEN